MEPNTGTDARGLGGVADALRRRADALAALEAAVPQIEEATAMVVRALRGGGKVLLFGNGGSAAIAEHLRAELVGRFACSRPGLPAIALTTDSATVTAIANDFGFESVFARQVEALGTPADVAIAMSTSGRSPNVLAGVEAARRVGMPVVALTGGDGGALTARADVAVAVAAEETAVVQEAHLTVGHIVCSLVDQAFCPNGREAE